MAAKVKLNRAGREYLHFPVTGLPTGVSGVMEILFPPATAWLAMEWVKQVSGEWIPWDGVTGLPTHARVLVSGPDVDPSGGVQLTLGTSNSPELRLANSPEIIVRISPVIVVVG